MSKMHETLQANVCANVTSNSHIKTFCLLHQEASIRIISYPLMRYAYTMFHTSSGKLMMEEWFSQGEKEVRDA